ncbi:MAG: hypothetical protein F6K47_17820 [Symploca sp. SIO2E6]|nr:hypothetical protein [Symploca sp. SIO2E6]
MESQKTQLQNSDNQLEQSANNAASNEQQQPAKKSRKLRPFAVMTS